jgi:hypothetical protein
LDRPAGGEFTQSLYHFQRPSCHEIVKIKKGGRSYFLPSLKNRTVPHYLVI